ncbi:MAG: DEAD/DEAH box helicase [Candidatus Latescibacterota bacterium]|nr:DEAD/DEAH box helicase [Candidatus Latescibacterota bacterium]
MDTETTFERLALIPQLLTALDGEGYTTPSPIQRDAIPEVLEGRDVLATAQTGTGKTAAFALPILQHLHQQPARGKKLRALILTPTRELALQIQESFDVYGRHLPLSSTVIVGGVAAGPQIKQLRRKPQVLVATPGRLLDLMGQGEVHLDAVEIAVLDEADRMLDMGFIHDVRRVVQALPRKRQTLLFSATLPQEITQLATDMLRDPARVAVAPTSTVADNIEQQVMFVEKADKRALLTDVLDDHGIERAIVFTRTKHRANRVARDLVKKGISADAIHSNKSQGARQRALGAFDAGNVRVLVATDIVSRGIDVDAITHVINFEIPNEPEAYVHRIGRTARAGAEGVAMSFCDQEELPYLRAIERLTGIELSEADDHRYHSDRIAALHGNDTGSARQKSNGNGRSTPRKPSPRRGRASTKTKGARRDGSRIHESKTNGSASHETAIKDLGPSKSNGVSRKNINSNNTSQRDRKTGGATTDSRRSKARTASGSKSRSKPPPQRTMASGRIVTVTNHRRDPVEVSSAIDGK